MPPFPTEALRAYAAAIVSTDGSGEPYERYRRMCDAVILGVVPDMPQNRFATLLGMSRTTLRAMLARCGVKRNDGRRAVPS